MGVLDLNRIAQVGYIVSDVETAKRSFAAIFGVEVPPTVDSGVYEVTKTEYMGKPAPEAACLMAFFNLDNGFQLELIQPNEAPSTWREFLNAHGDGIHHVAYRVTDMDAVIRGCEAEGMKLVQRGMYGDASGQYAYLEAQDSMKSIVELLENF